MMIKIIELIKVIGRFFLRIISAIQSIFRLITNKSYTQAESYYPEYIDRRKSKTEIFFDQLRWVLKYAHINEFYFLYGFDIKGLAKQVDYVDNTFFIGRRTRLNSDILHAPIAVLRDKYLFSLIAEGAGIPVPTTMGLIEDGMVLSRREGVMPIIDYLKSFDDTDVFIKSIDGECGDGVYHVKLSRGVITIGEKVIGDEAFLSVFSKGRFLIQERIVQHDRVNAIFPHSINTIRLVTVYNKNNKKVEVLSAGLRIGVGNNDVDNWAMGGVFVGIEKNTGKLRKYGFFKPGHGTKTTIHPDSSVIFEGYQVPYYAEAVELALKFHNVLKGVHSIGWDIAICSNGPCFIEGNDNWEISLMQVVDCGLKKEFDRLFL